MRDDTGGELRPSGGASPFDQIKHTDENGEYWLARELMPLLGYAKWERFADAIDRARTSIAATGMDPDLHVSRLREASGRTRQMRDDFRLTRHGAHMAAMNGDVRKKQIADAQTYFSVKTFEAESAAALAQIPQQPMSRKDLARQWFEAEEKAELEAARADKAEQRAEVAERKFAEFEGGPGITLTKFHKKFFSEVPERLFFEHVYAREYLIDQRGMGPWDEKNLCYRDGPQHFEPGAKGKPYLYLHEAGIYGGKRRFKTLVRPGDPELNFKARLVADGLRGNAHTTGYLFAIEGGR